MRRIGRLSIWEPMSSPGKPSHLALPQATSSPMLVIVQAPTQPMEACPGAPQRVLEVVWGRPSASSTRMTHRTKHRDSSDIGGEAYPKCEIRGTDHEHDHKTTSTAATALAGGEVRRAMSRTHHRYPNAAFSQPQAWCEYSGKRGSATLYQPKVSRTGRADHRGYPQPCMCRSLAGSGERPLCDLLPLHLSTS